MATSFLSLMALLAQEPGLTGKRVDDRLLYKFTAATIGNTSLTTTDPNIVALGSGYLAERFKGWGIYLETAAEEREVADMSVSGSTATINFIGGGNATNQAGATNVWLVRTGRWSELKAAANTVLEYLPVEVSIPLRHGPDDADTQAVATTAWTAGANMTVAKQTTAAEVLWGRRSMSLTSADAGTTATSTTVKFGKNEPVNAFALARADIGSWTFRVLDDAGNTLDSVTFTEEEWLFIRKSVWLESDDEGAALRFIGAANLDQADVQAAWMVDPNNNEFFLPSYADAEMKIKAIEVYRFRHAAAEPDTYLAKNVDVVRLARDEFRFIQRPSDANPNRLRIVDRSYLQYPIFVTIETTAADAYGNALTFSADADTTDVHPHLFLAAMKAWVGGQYSSVFPQAKEMGDREFAVRSRRRETKTPEIQTWGGPLGGLGL
ncbi:MAG: hypothetical protein AB7E70_20395 [Hyphomicrobiaceae bacterium]